MQLLLSQCPWKEYTTDTGKIYYHNVTTKESRWAIPPELEEIKKKILEEAKPKSTPATPNDVSSPLTASAPISGTTSPNVSNASK